MSAAIALIAHDRKKDDLVAFAKRHEPVLGRYRLIATEVTGQRIQEATKLKLDCVAPRNLGGDTQIAAEVVAGNIAAVIFLTDVTSEQAYGVPVQSLLRVCELHNVPLALNLATSEFVIDSLARTRVAHLIFNPVSGKGNADNELSLVRELLEPHFNLQVHLTTPEEGAEQLAQQAVTAEADLIIASGGDGTVSAVAGQVMKTGIPLGIIPRGTANAFSLALGIPTSLNTITPIRSACRVILEGHTQVVDAARCNNLPMVLLVGIGFEAEMVEKADRELKNRWGALAYLMAGWKQLDEQELFETTIESDGEVSEFPAGAITVANAAPPTSVLAQGGEVIWDDGLLDMTVATAATKMQAVTSMMNVLGAALIRADPAQPNVEHGRMKTMTITTDPPQKVVVDGEVIGTTPVEVECVPQALTVFMPKP